MELLYFNTEQLEGSCFIELHLAQAKNSWLSLRGHSSDVTHYKDYFTLIRSFYGKSGHLLHSNQNVGTHVFKR